MTDLGITLSVHAPWAWALMHGGKDVENRSKSFPRRRNGEEVLGRVWVHASLWPGGRGFPGPRSARWGPWHRKMLIARTGSGREVHHGETWRLRGHIVGSVEVYGYADESDSPWYVPGSLAILVRDPQPLAKPVPAKGALGWWTVPEPTLSQVRRAP